MLTNQEKNYLQLFWDDIPMREAVKKALFTELSGYKLNDATTLSNEEIGANARAALEARKIMQSQFSKISQFGKREGNKVEPNPAV